MRRVGEDGGAEGRGRLAPNERQVNLPDLPCWAQTICILEAQSTKCVLEPAPIHTILPNKTIQTHNQMYQNLSKIQLVTRKGNFHILLYNIVHHRKSLNVF